ncbi:MULTISPECIES: copper chaperone PCu(A)C [Rhodomicrobium]|uniref:copper chaperone PCu(A)C n=1 Tax=Rhodomicrobium TaxID=1068 RepID=UPI000B4B5391|nr:MULTISPECIES: copper chaperone PCu(A)C [Rhodomicrobium]
MLHFRNILRASLLSAALTITAAPLAAHEFKAGSLEIDHPWTRATPTGAKTAAGYMTITNHGTAPDRLVGGSADGVETVEVHQMSVENDLMKMRKLDDGVEIKPGETVEFKPSSYHLMMMGLKSGFKQGAMIKGALAFEKAGKVPVEFEVQAIGATGAEAHGHHKH